MPIRSRARTARAILRDEEILEAALAEVAESGLDALGMHAVARRVGITAGAVYARHETPDELAVAVWEEMSVDEFGQLDLGYAPPFSPVWDTTLIAARRAGERATATS